MPVQGFFHFLSTKGSYLFMILGIKLFSNHIILITIHIQKIIEFDEFPFSFSLRNKFDHHGSKNNQFGNLKCNNPRL